MSPAVSPAVSPTVSPTVSNSVEFVSVFVLHVGEGSGKNVFVRETVKHECLLMLSHDFLFGSVRARCVLFLLRGGGGTVPLGLKSRH